MKANTYVHIGFRNVGDADGAPRYHEGTLGESLMWLARELGTGFYMKNRVQIAIGRNKETVMIGLDVSRGPAKSKMDGIADLIASVLPDDFDSDDSDAVGSEVVESSQQPKNPKDDYVE